MKIVVILLLLALFPTAFGQISANQQFIRVDAPVVALTHVRIIDGTGAEPLEDQTIVIADGKIMGISPSGSLRDLDLGGLGSNAPRQASVEPTARILDLKGYTVLPGLVGMHDHMFFPMGGSPQTFSNMSTSFPRLYLALGVTTIRTTGSIVPYADLETKKLIDNGRMIGPKMHITGPYLEGAGGVTQMMHELSGPADARRLVNFWADQGATSFAVYMNITRDELRAVVQEAHKRGLKVTGHLCSVGYREAAEIGIDNIEHGLLADSEFVPNKQPDQYPSPVVSGSLRRLDINSDAAKKTIRALVSKNVALTSTLLVFEAGAPLAQTGIGAASAVLNPDVLSVMNADALVRYLKARSFIAPDSPAPLLIRKSMDFERAFVAAGGLLIAGSDPTGNGGIVAGFGDLREVELLVEALIGDMRRELKQHGEPVLDAHKMTFNELSERYSKLRLIPAVIVNGQKVAGLRSLGPPKAAMSILASHFGRKQVRTMKHSDVEEYKLKRLQTPVRCGTDEDDNPIYRPRSVAAVNRELELLRAVLRFAQREGWIVKSPFEMGAPLISKVSETRRDRVLSFDEEKRLLAACANKKRAHLRPLIITALDTGMRRGELFKLTWFDVDFKSNLIHVRATNTKTEQARTVGMTKRVRSELRVLRSKAPSDTSVSVFGIKNTVKNGFASTLKEAKIENFTFHDCRHTATTRLTTCGMPASEAMKITGHTQMTTFQRYVNITDDAARNGAERLDAFLSSQSKRIRSGNVLPLKAR